MNSVEDILPGCQLNAGDTIVAGSGGRGFQCAQLGHCNRSVADPAAISRIGNEDFKKAMVVKMTALGAQSATSLAKETGIPQSTLSRWLRSYATVRLEGETMTHRRPQDWNTEEKLEALLEYERSSEEQRGVFLR